MTEVIINIHRVEAQVVAGGVEVTLSDELITETIIGIPGPKGDPGLKGDPGAGIPVSGDTGQVLKKLSPTDFDVAWQDETGGGGGVFVAAPYTVAEAQAAVSILAAYAVIYVTDETGGATLAVSDGVDYFRRVSDREIIAAPAASLIINGSFDNDIAGWMATGGTYANIEWDAGRLKLTTTGGWIGPYQDVPVEVGKDYEISFDYERGTSNQMGFDAQPDTGLVYLGASGTHVETFTATTTNIRFKVTTANATGTLWIDNVLLNEV